MRRFTAVLTLVAPLACVIDRDLGDTEDDLRAEALVDECDAEPPAAEPQWRRTAPSDIAACTPVGALTLAEKTAWCEWYEGVYRPDGAAPPSEYLLRDGAVTGAASGAIGLAPGDIGFCVQHLPVEYCVANLSLSDCGAPLVAIERCARAILERGADEQLNERCRDLLDLHGCERTVVQQGFEGSPECPVLIE